MGGRCAVWGSVLVAVVGCTSSSGGPPTGSPDGGDRDAARPDASEGVPWTPTLCTARDAWVLYMADQEEENVEAFYVRRVADVPVGDPIRVSGDLDRVSDGPYAFGFSPDAGTIAMVARDAQLVGRLHVTRLSGLPPSPTQISGPFTLDGAVFGNGHAALVFRWSPDGTRFAYLADRGMDSNELWLADLDSDPPGLPQRLSIPPSDPDMSMFEFQWSADSTKILYRANHDSVTSRELFLVDLGGAVPAAPVKVNPDLEREQQAGGFLTPDGSTVVYLANDETLHHEVYVAYTDNPGTATRLTTGGGSQPTVSPDGTKLVYNQQIGDDLRIADLTTRPPTVRPEPLTGPDTQAFAGEIRWSPASTAILFLARFDAEIKANLYHVDVRGGSPTRINGPLPDGAGIRSFAWSPDGNFAMYEADQDEVSGIDLYLVDLRGPVPGAPIKLNATPEHPVEVTPVVTWSPDSRWLAYLADERIDGLRELFVVEIGAGPSEPVRLNHDLPAGEFIHSFRWSPDATRVIYQAGPNFQSEAWMVGLAAPGVAFRINGPFPDADRSVVRLEWGPCEQP